MIWIRKVFKGTRCIVGPFLRCTAEARASPAGAVLLGWPLSAFNYARLHVSRFDDLSHFGMSVTAMEVF